MIYNHAWTPSPQDGDDLRRLMAQLEERKRHFERLAEPALAAVADALLAKLRAGEHLTARSDGAVP
jgi:hypothetical protein